MLKPQSAVGVASARPLARIPPVVSLKRSRVAEISLPKQPWTVSKPTPQRRVAQVVAAQSGAGTPSAATDNGINFKKGFWTFVDVVAIFGSVGGALAAILNLFSGTYVLFLPLVLPVVSLLSALQREGLIAEDNRRAYDTLRSSLARDSSVMLADARSAIEDVRRELKGQNTTAARLGTIEARLSSLEGSILSAGRSAREAAAGLGVLPERLQNEQRVALEGLVAAMRLELRRAAESLVNNETTALARLDARLAAVEGSLSGLEVAQSEGLRRLSMSLNSALADAEATLQSSVRNEVARSMEPVRRLPQMLAAALPPALAAAEAVEASMAGPAGGALVGPMGPAGAAAVVSPEQLQAIVGQEVEGAVGRILAFQADAFGRLNAVRPMPLDEEQWSALGRRLTRLERLVEGVPTGTEGALLQGGQLAAAVAATVREALAAQLAEARAETAAVAAREAYGVRNDVLAVQTLLREQLDGLAAALQPLQLGVTELQVAAAAAAAAAAEQQRTQAAQADALAARQLAAEVGTEVGTRRHSGAGSTVDVTAVSAPVPPAELSRLLEGVAAVAALLRDLDAKMDAVAAAVTRLPEELAPPPSPLAAPPEVPSSSPPPPAEAQRQQQDLKEGMEAMREALAALAIQVGALAASPLAAISTAPTFGTVPAPAGTGRNRATEAASSSSSSSAVFPAAAGAAVADVLSFEASLASISTADEAEASRSGTVSASVSETLAAAAASGPVSTVDAEDRKPSPATAGASREEAYDLMLQLAEARRRSGSEAGASGSMATGGAAPAPQRARGASGSGAAGGGGMDSTGEGVEEHLQIEGLPPFEQEPSSPLLAAVSELASLPPPQSELEGAVAFPPVAADSSFQHGPEATSQPSPLQRPAQPPPPQVLRPQQPSWAANGVEAVQPVQAVPPGGYGSDAAAPGSLGAAYEWQDPAPSSSSAPPPPQQQQPLPAFQMPYETAEPGATLSAPGTPDRPRSPATEPGWGAQAPAASQAVTTTGPQSWERPAPYWPAGPADAPAGTDVSYQPAPAAASPASGWSSPPFATTTAAAGAGPSVMEPGPGAGFVGAPEAAAAAPQSQPQPPSRPSTPPLAVSQASPGYRMRPLEGLNNNEVISEGLRLLRLGREETRKGEDFGLADQLIQLSVTAFSTAASMAPSDTKALGNLGNALLARGELKAAYLEALRGGPPPSTYEEVEAQRGAEVAMTGEANALLTQAGVQFMKVLEMDGWSSRALVNWGRALVIRADLLAACPDAVGSPAGGPAAAGGGAAAQGVTAVTAVVAQLYTAAINKFEGVLEGEPDMVPAKYRCALAMAGLSRTRVPGSREAITLLVDAINYLRDVMASPSPDAEALRPAAGVALQQYEAQLMAQRATRGV